MEPPWSRNAETVSRVGGAGLRPGAVAPRRRAGGARGRRRRAPARGGGRRCHRAGGPRPPRCGAEPGGRRARRDARPDQVRDDRADHHRTVPEVLRHSGARLVGVVHAAEHDHHPVALHGAQSIQPDVARGPAYVVDDRLAGPVGAVHVRHPAEHHGHVAASLPAQGARARADRLVCLGAQHAVDHERLEPRVPRAAHLRGARVDLRGGERDLAGVAHHGVPHRGSRRSPRRRRRCCPRPPRWSAAPSRRFGGGSQHRSGCVGRRRTPRR